MKMIQCAGCDLPILDRFLLNVLDRSWHAKCVQCCECKCNLTDKCFSRDGKLFCRNDFFKRFGTKCAGCGHGILPTDLVRRARNKVFHLKCFTCYHCRKTLSTGEELYVVDENRFICKDDYLGRHNQGLTGGSPVDPDMEDSLVSPPDPDIGPHDSDHDDDLLGGSSLGIGLPSLNNSGHTGSGHGSSAMMSSKSSPMSASSSMSDSGISGANGTNGPDPTSPNHASGSNSAGNDENQPGGTKRRGPRTTIKAKQLETLKAAFAATPKPTRHIREQLAQETGLNMRVIQVWFQNRRSKERRMKQLSTLGARRHFFRSPRRAMRPLRPGLSPDGLEDSPEMVSGPNNGFGYFSDSSNPSEFPYGGPPPHHGPFYDFFPGQHGPPPGLHNGDVQSGLLPQYVSGNPSSHPPTSAPGLHDGIHQSAFRGSMGSVNLGADAPYMGGGAPGGHGPSPADLMAAQQRGSASPNVDNVLNLPPLTPDTYGRSSSESNNGQNSTGFSTPLPHPPISEQSVW